MYYDFGVGLFVPFACPLLGLYFFGVFIKKRARLCDINGYDLCA